MNTSNAKPEPMDVIVDDQTLTIAFSDGTRATVPLSYSPRLRDATPDQRSRWEWIGRRSGVHWPEVDEDLSVSGLVRDAASGKVLAEVA